MLTWCVTGLLCLSLGSVSALGQGAPALDTFNSPDGNFQFVYPENYQLLVGERMLKATQGRNVGIPVCDFSTAIACVIYPVETAAVEAEGDGRFEAAGFSVRAVAEVMSESDCLNYADLVARVPGEPSPLLAKDARSGAPPFLVTSIAINGRVFRHVFVRKTIVGHLQAVDSYRTFQAQKCYEVPIEVSMADEPALQKAAQSSSLGDPRADSARESLRLILSSVVFEEQ
jgi:hypothetical protein